MADVAGWVQAGVAGTIATVGTIFFAGADHRALADQAQQIDQVKQQQQSDHDKVVTNDSKLDDIKQDVAEIKADVKSLVRNVH